MTPTKRSSFSPADRYATGIRNAEGYAIDSAGRIFVTQHGRDQLHSNWPELLQAGRGSDAARRRGDAFEIRRRLWLA